MVVLELRRSSVRLEGRRPRSIRLVVALVSREEDLVFRLARREQLLRLAVCGSLDDVVGGFGAVRPSARAVRMLCQIRLDSAEQLGLVTRTQRGRTVMRSTSTGAAGITS